MNHLFYQTKSVLQTFKMGEKIGKILQGGTILQLNGDLGTGKTLFIKGLAAGLNIRQEITSPTFALIQSYSGKLKLHHIDLYRLTHKEILELGLEEFWRGWHSNAPNWLIAVEWAKKAERLFPAEKSSLSILEFNFKILSKYSRTIEIKGINKCLNLIQSRLPKSWLLKPPIKS